jgi:hypothetical protein
MQPKSTEDTHLERQSAHPLGGVKQEQQRKLQPGGDSSSLRSTRAYSKGQNAVIHLRSRREPLLPRPGSKGVAPSVGVAHPRDRTENRDIVTTQIFEK